MAVSDEAAAPRAARRRGERRRADRSPRHALDALPFDDDAFDVVVVHGVNGLLPSLNDQARADRALRETRRVLRHGGRVIVIEAGPKSGLAGVIRPYRPDVKYEAAGGAVAALQAAGFKPVRMLWEREGYRFTEGLKT